MSSPFFFFSVILVFFSYIFCSSFFLPFSFIFFVLPASPSWEFAPSLPCIRISLQIRDLSEYLIKKRECFKYKCCSVTGRKTILLSRMPNVLVFLARL